MQKQQVFKVKGMQRDLSMANTNGEFAYEILNMRLMPSEENSGFSLTNEQGTTLLKDITLNGQIIGQCPTTNSLVVFTTDGKGNDYIYEIYFQDDKWTYRTIVNRNLGFSVDAPIEALFNYETEDLQKIYWIDGINPLRSLNLKVDNTNKVSFDSAKELRVEPNGFVSITRGTSGSFAAGVIQYIITAFNPYEVESGVVYTSPLLYLTVGNRGVKTDEKSADSFTLTIDPSKFVAEFSFLRIYRIHRTSLDATPDAQIIQEVKIPDDKSNLSITDVGRAGVAISPSDLLFKKMLNVAAKTMTVKDNTMFLGNLKTANTATLFPLRDGYIDEIKNRKLVSTEYRNIPYSFDELEGTYYNFQSRLNNVSPITHYKYLETYRLGFQLQDKYGNWSNPVWIGDYQMEASPEIGSDEQSIALPYFTCELSLEVLSIIFDATEEDIAARFTNVRPLVVFPNVNERSVLAQGVVNPTVYNLKDRKENAPYSQASWFFRPELPRNIYSSLNDYTSIDGSESPKIPIATASAFKTTVASLVLDDVEISYLSSDKGTKPYGYNSFSYWPARSTESDAECILYDGEANDSSPAKFIVDTGCWLEFRHNYALRSKGWTWGTSSEHYSNQFPRLGGKDEDETPDEFYSDEDFQFYNNKAREWGSFVYKFLSKEEFTLGEAANKNLIYISPDTDIYNDAELPRDLTIATYTNQGDSKKNRRWLLYSVNLGNARCAELDTSRFGVTMPINKIRSTGNYFNGATLDTFNTGNSAYYIDKSIVTLNSPELEMSNELSNIQTSDLKFRIIGLIPITSNYSECSLQTKNNYYHPDIDDASLTSLGFKEVIASTKNIGHHAFRSMVACNTYTSGFNPSSKDEFENNSTNGDHPEKSNVSQEDIQWTEKYYASTLLHPWQSTGYIPGFTSDFTDAPNYGSLKTKVLANLRYSANTYYFKPTNTILGKQNKVWTPASCNVQLFDKTDTSIIKINPLNYNESLVYGGNIDSIALTTSGDKDSTPMKVYSYFYGRKLVSDDNVPIDSVPYYVGGMAVDSHYKTGVGASIQYKSTSHYVIGFGLKEGKYGKDNLPYLQQEILPCISNRVGDTLPLSEDDIAHVLYENNKIISLPYQEFIHGVSRLGLPSGDYPTTHSQSGGTSLNYGYLWLGEIYRDKRPEFGGISEFAIQNNQWEIGGELAKAVYSYKINTIGTVTSKSWIDFNDVPAEIELERRKNDVVVTIDALHGNDDRQIIIKLIIPSDVCSKIQNAITSKDTALGRVMVQEISYEIIAEGAEYIWDRYNSEQFPYLFISFKDTGTVTMTLDYYIDPTGQESTISINNLPFELFNLNTYFSTYRAEWTNGDTYYSRFDSLKTYPYSESAENSIIETLSFMVETRINLDARTDRNRGTENLLNISPENYNLTNEVYNQRDNFFTYRILPEDLELRTYFPTQITWSLTKTAGEIIDSWMNITLASVLDLDGTKGKISALKNFNNNIIAFQEKGLSHIMFNSRAQIATSEAVPIQIANTGKVDGQQYLTTDIGCQDKWNIVTTPNGLYFIDYFNKSVYRFNGKLEDISTPNGFRSWCYENLNSTANILGYYDVKNKEVMYYIGDTGFKLSQHYLDGEVLKSIKPQWLGFSELTNAFSSFYTYPKAWLANVQDQGLWLLSGENNTTVFTHQTGDYNQLLNTSEPFYGLTIIPRQDSNTVKTFNNVEFRSDSYNGSILDNNNTFNTISAETEYQPRTTDTLTYSQYRPSNLKKKLRTWRANIPRVNNGYNRFVNQWAKIGLWKMNPNTEKTILHDLSVWYSE